jgi:hypothetical protein
MSRDILNFLFSESFKPTSDEAISSVFEKMSEIEDIESKKGSLAKALKEFGHTGDVCINDDGTAQVCTDSEIAYGELEGKLSDPDAILKLAELGWVAAYCGDDQDALAPEAHLVIKFINITEPTPSDGDKIEDLEKILATMNEPNADGPEGIGSDLKVDGGKQKEIKVPDAKNPKPEIKK